MNDFVKKETCHIIMENITNSVDKLCIKIDTLVELSAENEKNLYLHNLKFGYVEENAKETSKKLDEVEIATVKNTTMWKIFAIVAGILTIGGGAAYGIIKYL